MACVELGGSSYCSVHLLLACWGCCACLMHGDLACHPAVCCEGRWVPPWVPMVTAGGTGPCTLTGLGLKRFVSRG